MHVLRLLKCAAYFGIALCYWLLLNGRHEAGVYAALCGLYLLLCAVEAAEAD